MKEEKYIYTENSLFRRSKNAQNIQEHQKWVCIYLANIYTVHLISINFSCLVEKLVVDSDFVYCFEDTFSF